MTAGALDETPKPATRRETAPASLVAGLLIIAAWVILAVAAPWIAGADDPNALDLAAVLQPPGPSHWFGTDHLGRDVLARTLFSARIDLWMGLVGVAAPLVIGCTVGLLAGYFGGMIDAFLMRVVDVTTAFPFFVLVLAIVAVLGPGLSNYFIALALVGWVAYARIIRAEILLIRSAEYVLAARTLGFGPLTIMLRHVLPNAVSPVLTYAMTDAILVILAGASLGFLGMGVQPPTPEWGTMIADGQPYIASAWWISLFPGLAAMTLGLGFALTGDGLARLLRVSR